MNRADANGSRFDPSDRGGFYESWFVRANHPSRPLSFWSRYTVFAPRQPGGTPVGELWAISFDGERRQIVAVKETVAIERCRFGRKGLDVRIADARLEEGLSGAVSLSGAASREEHRIAWDLSFSSRGEPLLLIPEAFYRGPFPKTKSVTAVPSTRISGTLEVDGETRAIDGWRGAQSHNWGSSQTDEYAWAQVAAFDGAEGSVLECIAARVRVAPFLPLLTPLSSVVVLRHEGTSYTLNGPFDWLRTRATYDVGRLTLSARRGDVAIDVVVDAPKSAFVALAYPNPPGGTKICHNTKLARAEVRLRVGERTTVLTSAHGAALEVVGDHADGVPIAIGSPAG